MCRVENENVELNDWLASKSLLEAGLLREGVVILGIQSTKRLLYRGTAGYQQYQSRDILVMYGPM